VRCPYTRPVTARGRPFWVLITAEAISATGSQISNVALPWFVLTTTGSATRMGIVLTAELAGIGLVGLPAGVLAGRLGARRTMLACDAFRAVLTALVPGLHALGALSFPLLVLIAFALGAAFSPAVASQRAILPELVGVDEGQVGQAAALLQAATRGALLIGPVLGGILISLVGAPGALLVDAGTYVVSFTMMAALLPRRADAGLDASGGSLFDGVRHLVRDRVLRRSTLAFSGSEAAFQALFAALPVLVFTRFRSDPALFGWLLAAFGGGGLAGSLLAARLLLRLPALRLARAASLVRVAPLWLLAVATSRWPALFALAVAGTANGVLNPAIYAVQTGRLSKQHRTAGASAFVTVTLAAGAVGLALAGPSLQHFGLRPVLVAIAAVESIATLMLLSARARLASIPGQNAIR
jgi:predicted MFS family arabinose efflux permease